VQRFRNERSDRGSQGRSGGFSSNRRSGGFSGQRRAPRSRGQYIDPSLFVRKATADEQVAYQPTHAFADFAVCDALRFAIERRGYITPTPIQDQAIPVILEGNDIIGIASTGTGKTAAFLIPLINKVTLNPEQRVLIIAPTRELALQIEDELHRFSGELRLTSVLCIGGVGLGGQIAGLRRQPQFVIGTPGRLEDLAKQRVLHFDRFQSIVLDEVDRMLDMGFIQTIERIIAQLPTERQSLFFSATVPAKVAGLMQQFLRNPITVKIPSQDTSANVDQDVIRTNGRPKIEILHELLIQESWEKVLIFGRTKHGIEKLTQNLYARGIRVASIHGNKSQSQRQRALEQFKKNKIQVLTATDVASRGIDVKNVTHVVNYEVPETYEDYIHRIGRTGRADQKGIALTFID
jgi:ATP-dependent RNA helicase RhlE